MEEIRRRRIKRKRIGKYEEENRRKRKEGRGGEKIQNFSLEVFF